MDYSKLQDLYSAPGYGATVKAERSPGSPIQPWSSAVPERRRSSNQTEVSVVSEDELDRYANIRPAHVRPKMAPAFSPYWRLRRKSTNLDRYINLSESVNTVMASSVESEQPRYRSSLFRIVEAPSDLMQAQDEDKTLRHRTEQSLPTQTLPLEESRKAAAVDEKKSSRSGKWAQSTPARLTTVSRSINAKEMTQGAVAADTFTAKRMFRSDECGQRGWAVMRPDATAHSSPVTSMGKFDAPERETTETTSPSKAAGLDPSPQPTTLRTSCVVVSPTRSTAASAWTSETSSSSSGSSTDTSDEDSDATQTISAYGDSVSKSTWRSRKAKSPFSHTGTVTASSAPISPSSASRTSSAVKSPDATVSTITKYLQVDRTKSLERRSSLPTTPPTASTTPNIRSKEMPTPSTVTARGPPTPLMQSKSPHSTVRTPSTPKSISVTPTCGARTPPGPLVTATPQYHTPSLSSPWTPPSILRSNKRSSSKRVQSQSLVTDAGADAHILGARMYQPITRAAGAEEAQPQGGSSSIELPVSHQKPDIRNDKASTAKESKQLSVRSQNHGRRKPISLGRLSSALTQGVDPMPPLSSSLNDVLTSKFAARTMGIIQRKASPITRAPIISISMPETKGTRAKMENPVCGAPTSRCTRPDHIASNSFEMMEEGPVMARNFLPPMQEGMACSQKPVSVQTSPKPRTCKAIQHPALATFPAMLESPNFQTSKTSTGQPLLSPVKRRSKSDSSILMHMCVAINVILFSALSGIVFAYFLNMNQAKKS